jgi:hypothetical protein
VESLGIVEQRTSLNEREKGKRKVEEGVEGLGIARVECREEEAPRISWAPPPQGWIKVYTDVAYMPSTDDASAGIIARDSGGEVVLIAWHIVRGCRSPGSAEVKAFLTGLRLAVEWIRQPVILESDCETLIHDLGKQDNDCSSWSGVLAVEESATRAHGPPCSPRLNGAALDLAQRAIRELECVVKRHGAPECVRDMIRREAAGTHDTSHDCNAQKK